MFWTLGAAGLGGSYLLPHPNIFPHPTHANAQMFCRNALPVPLRGAAVSLSASFPVLGLLLAGSSMAVWWEMPTATTLSRKLPAWAHGIPTNTAAAPEERASPLSTSGTTAQTKLHSFYEFLCFLLLNSTSLRF